MNKGQVAAILRVLRSINIRAFAAGFDRINGGVAAILGRLPRTGRPGYFLPLQLALEAGGKWKVRIAGHEEFSEKIEDPRRLDRLAAILFYCLIQAERYEKPDGTFTVRIPGHDLGAAALGWKSPATFLELGRTWRIVVDGKVKWFSGVNCECEDLSCAHNPGACPEAMVAENATIYGTRLCPSCWSKMPDEFRKKGTCR